jgi:Dockerin type I domain
MAVVLCSVVVSISKASILDPPPVIVNCPSDLLFDHCAQAVFEFQAVDSELVAPSFVVIEGQGEFVAGCGFWVYNPTIADVGISQRLVVAAKDGVSGDIGPPDTVMLTFSNRKPELTGQCDEEVSAGVGDPVEFQIKGVSYDCDLPMYIVPSVTPAPSGKYQIDQYSGAFKFIPAERDRGKRFEFTVCVSDKADSDCCSWIVNVDDLQPMQIRIDTTHDTYQGMSERVSVIFEKGTREFSGFDFSIAYDPGALSVQTPIKGASLFSPSPTGCAWEEFRFENRSDNAGTLPKGMSIIRVIGKATSSDTGKPTCFSPKLPAVLFTLEFLVTDNRTYESQFVPLRFVWLDCTDNVLFLKAGDSRAISHSIFDPKREKLIKDSLNDYPTFAGVRGDGCASDSLLQGNSRLVDFVNGGIRIGGPGIMDVGGDLNLNEICYEIADVTLLTRCLIFGDTVFRINLMGQIASSDVNHDGKTLTVMDLAYLARVVTGDAAPPPVRMPFPTFPATLSRRGDILNVNRTIGAGLIHVLGDAIPTLLISGANMLFYYDSTVTRILVWDLPMDTVSNRIIGDFIKVPAPIVFTEMATYEGYQLDVMYSCCSGLRGDANGDGKFLPTLEDASALTAYLGRQNAPFCEVEADVNGDGAINISDAAYLIEYLYNKGPKPVMCLPAQ